MQPNHLSYEPILFLDFDGVLHPANAHPWDFFSLVLCLEAVISARPRIDIVVSSAWRLGRSVEELRTFFTKEISSRIIDKTPDWLPVEELPDQLWAYPREAECAVWIERHRRHTAWVALDDEAWRYRPFSQHLVLVDGELGLQEEDVDRALQKLQRMAQT